MFANLRVSVKSRQRYLARRGQVIIEMKRAPISMPAACCCKRPALIILVLMQVSA